MYVVSRVYHTPSHSGIRPVAVFKTKEAAEKFYPNRRLFVISKITDYTTI